MSAGNCVESNDVVPDALPDPPRIKNCDIDQNQTRTGPMESVNSENGTTDNLGDSFKTECQRSASNLHGRNAVIDGEPNQGQQKKNESSESTSHENESTQSKGARTKTGFKSSRSKTKPNVHTGPNYVFYKSNVNLKNNTTTIVNNNHWENSKESNNKNSGNGSGQETRKMPAHVESLCKSQAVISRNDMLDIKIYLGNYEELAIKLGFTKGQIIQIEKDSDNCSDIVYKILKKWHKWNGSKATIGFLTEVMWSCKEYDCVEKFAEILKERHETPESQIC